MNFLFVTLGYHPHPIGGAWRYAAELAERLAARGHHVEVITCDPQNTLPKREECNGALIHRYPNARGGFVFSWRRENADAHQLIASALRGMNGPALVTLHHAFLAPSLAHVHAPRAHVFHGPWGEEYLQSRRGRHGSLLRRKMDAVIARRLRGVERRAVHRATGIVVLSRHMEERLKKLHGAALPVRVIGGGVNLEQFKPVTDRDALRRRLHLKHGDFLWLSTRRLDARMGLDVLLRAFAVINGACPHARLWLTGDGPDAAKLSKLSDELGLGRQVEFLGSVPDARLVELFNAADCAIMPSLDLEGFGLATAEALACGTPVIGSDSGATPEVLADLAPGLIFSTASVDGLADLMQRVLSGAYVPPARVECRRYAEARFSWEPTVAAFEAMAERAGQGGAP